MSNAYHLDDVNTLNLKITPMITPPPAVYAHQVPIFVCSAEDMEATKVDLTLQQVWLCDSHADIITMCM